MRRGDRLGLGGAALTEVHGADDDCGHGEKLALPVLERLESEMRITEIPPNGRRDLAMLTRFLRGDSGALGPVHNEREQKQDEKHGA